MPNSKRIAIFSDLHLGVHVNSPVWHEVALNWAKWVTSELEKQNIKEIIFCGDFFHNRSEITVNTLHQASLILDMFDDFHVYMLAGNHDSFYKNNCSVNSIRIFSGRKNITIIDTPKTLQLGSKRCFFAPWGIELSKIEKADVLFGHLEIESFKMNAHKLCDHGFKTEDLLNFAPLVISGHFHLREERSYKRGTVLYVGSPFQLDFGDEGSTKGYYILNLDDLTYEFFENKISPKHLKIKLSDLIKINNFKTVGRDIIGNNIIKLEVDKTISNSDLDKLSTKIGTYSPLSYVVDNITNFDRFGAANQEEVDLSGVDITKAITDFVELLDIQNKKDVVEYTISLYNQCR